jgi:hypothetical protein
MKIQIGQRWLYSDTHYTWVVEVSRIDSPQGVIIQIIRNTHADSANYIPYYNIGDSTSMGAYDTHNSCYWTYLPNQESPQI